MKLMFAIPGHYWNGGEKFILLFSGLCAREWLSL